MRPNKTFAVLTAVLTFVAISYAAKARESLWKSMGRDEATSTQLRIAEIDVDRKKFYSNIRVSAISNGIYLRRVVVTFGNGERQYFLIDRLIDEGGESPVMDLLGRRRHIKDARVEYAPRATGKARTVIELEGDTRPEEKRRPPATTKQNLEAVGNTRLESGADNVRVDVDTARGPFSQIAIRPNTNSVRIKSVKVFFKNGQSDSVDLNQFVEPGGRSGLIEFDSPRRVTRVDVRIRPLKKLRPSNGTTPNLYILGQVAGGSGMAAMPEGWIRLAKKPMSTLSGTEVIRVTGKEKRFDKIVMRALDGATYIKHVVVAYGNGQRDRIPVYNELVAPEQTRALTLNGNRRVSEIAITYNDAQEGNRAGKRKDNVRPVIDVFGFSSADYRPATPKKDEWVLLGTRSAAMFNRDRDDFKVGKNAGRFSKIRVIAKRHDIRMYGMQIKYGNGSVESVPLYGTLQDGQTSSEFDLKGKERFIDSIVFQYRTRLNLAGPGEVELWGLKQ